MERKLILGDYVPDGAGGLTVLEGSQEVLARALYRLTARRGALAFLPGLGSRLHLLGRERPSLRQALAAQYAAEALREEPELTVESVELAQGGETGQLTVYLRWRGEELAAQVAVQGVGNG